MTSRVLQPANGGYLKIGNPKILLQHFFECGAVTRGRVHQHPVHIEDDRGETAVCVHCNPRSSHHYSVPMRMTGTRGSRSVTKHWTLDKHPQSAIPRLKNERDAQAAGAFVDTGTHGATLSVTEVLQVRRMMVSEADEPGARPLNSVSDCLHGTDRCI